MKRVFVKAKDGGMIRNPKDKSKLMPEKGFWIDLDGSEGKYWRRRLSHGDIIISNEKEDKEKK